MPSLSPTCLALVKNFEGFRAEPVRLVDGTWLSGFGHVTPAEPAAPSEQIAEALLKEDLEEIAAGVRTMVHATLTQCQFDALVGFAFSIGLKAFGTSDVLRFVNAGQPIAAACSMDSWRVSATQPGVVLDALVRRRALEKSLFLHEGIRATAPSALVRPDIDPTIALLANELPKRGSQSEEETASKLRAILAGEPQTAHALKAPIAEIMEEPEPTPPKKAPSTQRDLIGHAALGALGLLLIGMGITGAGDDHGVAHIVFTVPGIIAAVMSAYYLLRSAAE